MVARCTNEKHPKYYLYGGRGIRVCRRWRVFINFLADMGERPSTDHSIDRRRPNRNYCKSNCRWATYEVQNGHLAPPYTRKPKPRPVEDDPEYCPANDGVAPF